jgi:serine/threonine protein kinase
MAEQDEIKFPIIKLALEKKLVTQAQIDQCRELVKKSNRIGLSATLEEVMIKQGVLTEDDVQDLQNMCQIADGGTIFGTYRLGKLIGEGGMGKVYEAVHEFMGRTVAIKVIGSKFTDDKNKTTRFYQEIKALAKLNHPNIVNIYDAGKVNRRHYFSMELLSGPSLNAYVDSKKFLQEKEALQIIRATARALGHAHSKSVIHRDVKPENIIFDANMMPKLTDFGLVMHFDTDHMTLTQEGMMVGTFHFVSPEQAEGRRDIDGRSDIYSLGATLYYTLTGHTVYSASSPQELVAKLMKGQYVSPQTYNPHISSNTIKLLRKMLAVDREQRYQSMADVIKAIECPSLFSKKRLIAAAFLAGSVLFIAGMLIERIFHLL